MSAVWSSPISSTSPPLVEHHAGLCDATWLARRQPQRREHLRVSVPERRPRRAVPHGVKRPNGTNYFYAHTQVNAQSFFYVGKDLTILASGQNMNDEVFGFYNGSPQYMVQREYYKPTYSGGLRCNLHREQ